MAARIFLRMNVGGTGLVGIAECRIGRTGEDTKMCRVQDESDSGWGMQWPIKGNEGQQGKINDARGAVVDRGCDAV